LEFSKEACLFGLSRGYFDNGYLGRWFGNRQAVLAPIFYVRLDGFAQKIFDFVDKPVPRLM
jgi:hypothetical protein